jgi:hypothetical protein
MTGNRTAELASALRLAIANMGSFPGHLTVETIAEEPWASATFSGARHQLSVTFEGSGAVGAAADLLERLDDLEVALAGQIVADLTLLADSRGDDGGYARLELEALTIDE